MEVQLCRGLGPSGPPLLSGELQYSLMHLLRRSPPHPATWEGWRDVATATVHGLQVGCVWGSVVCGAAQHAQHGVCGVVHSMWCVVHWRPARPYSHSSARSVKSCHTPHRTTRCHLLLLPLLLLALLLLLLLCRCCCHACQGQCLT